ncbi:histidine kinase [Dactylosporangium vinaceum]|uniref:histidine kinase n=1 Tax=Dactylosporangium vinaceum TaxID=53362 RepID=A0ABV5MQT6_9ACTN|nr:histidine kinase [Dactylosporangium vinaceum]UAB99166.1 histidine kinase [Dactylosporangium vinaceum]
MQVQVRGHWRPALDAVLFALVAVLFALSGTAISVPLAVAQVLPLLVRRRYPGAALAVIAVATSAHSLLGMARAVGYLPVALAVYSAATHRSPWVRWVACGGAVVLVTVTGAIRHGPVEGGLLAAVALIVTWLAGAERAVIAQLRLERHLADQAAATARSRERLARRLHDSLAHTMTVMLVQGEALRATARLTTEDEERLALVLQAGRTALADVRLALAEETQRDAAAALDGRLAALREAGLRAADPPGLDALPPAAREVAYRLLGEAATNALRHDGPGTRLTAELIRAAERTSLRVTSTPRTGHPRPAGRTPAGGFGLSSLADDVTAIGGTLTYGPAGGSWTVRADFPTPGPPHPAEPAGGPTP